VASLTLQAGQLKGMAAEARAVLRRFWGGGRLQLLCTTVIEKFLPLTVRLPCPPHPLLCSCIAPNACAAHHFVIFALLCCMMLLLSCHASAASDPGTVCSTA
jgi:hypothetical protein